MLNICKHLIISFDIQGAVRFTETGDREGPMKLEQNQNGTMYIVGLYNPAAKPGKQFSLTNDPPIYWQDGKPPVDEFIERERYQEIFMALFITIATLSSLGIILTIFFLIFNVKYRNHKMIKMSSPRLNNLILAGGFLAYASNILSGMDSGLLSEYYLAFTCKTYIWCLTMAFALSYGAMFSKTWRVYKIFTNKSVIPTRIRDPQLFGWVAVLVLINIIVLVLWEILDPVSIVTNRGEPKTSAENDDVIITPLLDTCVSRWKLYWQCVFFFIYGILFIFGAFLAWETRNVQIPALNDSKMIGISMYTVVTMCFTGVPVSFLVIEPNANFALLSIFTFVSTTLTLCLIFIPKVKSRNDDISGMVIKSQTSENGNSAISNKPNPNSQGQPNASASANNTIANPNAI
ncbi:gamma-aminobutyric acid type B receptor subunit 2-like [Amphiura filiformis]|uniref:gamma-aminobutyric acid type B receptor subunit 2-like n=1 Tax=Amphiura filiformis TaxID=82378 RepID=UPI003B21266F